MLGKIKWFAIRALSSVLGIVMFVFMLPLTLGMMLLVVLFGIATKATLTSHLKKRADPAGHSDNQASGQQPAGTTKKPPIEGSYTVIDK